MLTFCPGVGVCACAHADGRPIQISAGWECRFLSGASTEEPMRQPCVDDFVRLLQDIPELGLIRSEIVWKLVSNPPSQR